MGLNRAVVHLNCDMAVSCKVDKGKKCSASMCYIRLKHGDFGYS